jgi:hypothetical protein
MQSRLWAADERLNGMAHGFMELSQNGYRVIGHPGDTPLFHSILALLPEQNVGIFFSYNTSAYGLATPLLESFMDHYYPPQATAPPAPAEPADSMERFTGTYQDMRYAYSKGGRLKALFYPTFAVQAASDRELVFDIGDGPQQLIQVAPGYFEAIDGDLRTVFRENSSGEIAYLNVSPMPMMTFKKLAWYETLAFNLPLLGVSAALFLLVLVVEPLRMLVGWFKRRTWSPQPNLARTARGVMTALAVLALGLLFGLYWQVIENGAQIPMGERGLLTILGGISILVVAFASGTVVLAIFAWHRGWWNIAARIYYSLVAVAAIGFIWFLAFWNQIGWQWW